MEKTMELTTRVEHHSICKTGGRGSSEEECIQLCTPWLGLLHPISALPSPLAEKAGLPFTTFHSTFVPNVLSYAV